MAMSTDPRFARLQTDPRFRRPRQKSFKVEIDDRFRDVLEKEEFGGSGKGKGRANEARVDKRGRPVTSSHHADQVKRFYRLRSSSPTAASSKTLGVVDYARGEDVLTSSGSEDEGSEPESEIEDEELELGGTSGRLPELDADEETETEESHLEIDLSEEDGPHVPEERENSQEEAEVAAPTKRIAAVNLDWDNLRAGDLFAAFNSFLKGGSGADGRLLSVYIYPSEFGKSRMEKEEQHGPGGGIFAGKAGAKRDGRKEWLFRHEDLQEDEKEEDSELEDGADGQSADGTGYLLEAENDEEEGTFDEDDERSDEDDDLDISQAEGHGAQEIDGLEIVSDVSSEAGEGDIDMDQLRQYQLERLRYSYAIATFSTVAAARHVMDQCNGAEFERTANMMNLSYVSDEMDFADDEIQDEATSELKGYKGNDFVTDALRHSKVRLTWDQDDPNRTKITRHNLTREEIETQDFNAFVASSASEDGEEQSDHRPSRPVPIKAKVDRETEKQAKKERTAKLRALLFNNGDENDDVWGKAGSSRQNELGPKKRSKAANGDMEITFRPGLDASSAAGVGDELNLTTRERYQMRMKERKARKKEKAELKRAGKEDEADPDGQGGEDDFFGEESDSEDAPAPKSKVAPLKSKTSVAVTKPVPKDQALGDSGGVEHFSLKDIMKAEKVEGKKRKRKRPGKRSKGAEFEREVELGPADWKIDVKDQRFKALHEEPEFAIDPSNPHFTKTNAMKEMLAERARWRAKDGSKRPVEGMQRTSQPDSQRNGDEKDLNALVRSVKRRSDQNQHRWKKAV